MHGFTDNYIRVEIKRDNELDNRIITVRLEGFNEDETSLVGTIV